MTLKELSQLYYLNREIELGKERLANLDAEIKEDEEQLADLESIASSPSSSNYDGMPKSPSQGNKIENDVERIWVLEEIIKRKKALRCDIEMTIQASQILCLTERSKLERYITGLPDSLLRLIFTYRFIKGLTWPQVAFKVGGNNTEASVKMMCYRYIKKSDA